ncbi:AT-rich interactive domain-containing protein 4B-like [Uloborus diversus]|uniref:AT-rich interactive domain-containing protein 4B-like n=1 Tax=Uloborus diversus TaxID=327109 RepID=UPI002409E48C|nr:AT-rich interactive domain-containing protein 4B-like [Uloborus diversus]
MAADEPPYLTVGTDVSAKYKGAFCEAKIKKVNRVVKCKVTFKNNLGSFMVTDDQIKGSLRIGSDIEAKHPEKSQYLEAVINKVQDYSQYTVVFDDGDETTLRRTSLCLKSGRHFAESPTLDQFPLTNPEHFGTPVIGSGKYKRKRRSTLNSSLDYESSDDEVLPRKLKAIRGKERDPDLGKVVCVDYGDRRKKDNWYPGLIVPHPPQSNIKLSKEEHMIRSFKDGKYYQVPKRDTREFTRDNIHKIENNALKVAVDKAILYLEKEELPPHWDKALFLNLELPSADEDSNDSDSDSSDDEPSEEKDRFVAQLYKFMDERGTPINKAPTVSNRDLNLYKLFKIMHKLGGYNKVTNKNKWKAVYSKMGLPASNVNGPNQIKFAYKRYLQSFEDFYRKLGCTMVSNSRTTRGRHRSDRNFIITRTKEKDTASPKSRNSKDKAVTEKKVDEKAKTNERKDTKLEENVKSEEKGKSPDKKKPERLRTDEKDKDEKKKREEKPRLVRQQSLNKDKKDSVKEEEKKDTKPEKARTREDARKEKNESPEKKGTRSSVKIELERKEREEALKDKKEKSPNEKNKKEEKIQKDVKEEKPKEKKEEKINKEKKVVKEKKVEEKSVREKRENVVREKKEEKVVKEKRDSSKEPKEEKAVKGKKEDIKSPVEEKPIPKKKLDRVAKEKKEEKLVRPKREDKSPSSDTCKKIVEDTDSKSIKDEKQIKSEPEIKKEDLPVKEKPRPKLREKRDDAPNSEDGDAMNEAEISDEKDSTSQDDFERQGPGSQLKGDDCDEPPNKGKRRSLKLEDRDDKESLPGFTDSDDEFGNDSEKSFNKDVKHNEIEIGDRVKVKYGRGRMQKVYEAKVLKIEMEGQEKRFYVHYAGWNMRYDEWVRKSYIVAVISSNKQKGEGSSKSPLPSTNVKKIDRGKPPGVMLNTKPVRKNSTSSTNSSVSCSRATRSDKKSLSSPLSSGLEPKKRTRRKSGTTIGLTDTSQDSESDVEEDLDDDDVGDADIEDNALNQSDCCFKEELFSDDEEKEKLEDVKRGDITELEKAISVEESTDDMKDEFLPCISKVADSFENKPVENVCKTEENVVKEPEKVKAEMKDSCKDNSIVLSKDIKGEPDTSVLSDISPVTIAPKNYSDIIKPSKILFPASAEQKEVKTEKSSILPTLINPLPSVKCNIDGTDSSSKNTSFNSTSSTVTTSANLIPVKNASVSLVALPSVFKPTSASLISSSIKTASLSSTIKSSSSPIPSPIIKTASSSPNSSSAIKNAPLSLLSSSSNKIASTPLIPSAATKATPPAVELTPPVTKEMSLSTHSISSAVVSPSLKSTTSVAEPSTPSKSTLSFSGLHGLIEKCAFEKIVAPEKSAMENLSKIVSTESATPSFISKSNILFDSKLKSSSNLFKCERSIPSGFIPVLNAPQKLDFGKKENLGAPIVAPNIFCPVKPSNVVTQSKEMKEEGLEKKVVKKDSTDDKIPAKQKDDFFPKFLENKPAVPSLLPFKTGTLSPAKFSCSPSQNENKPKDTFDLLVESSSGFSSKEPKNVVNISDNVFSLSFSNPSPKETLEQPFKLSTSSENPFCIKPKSTDTVDLSKTIPSILERLKKDVAGQKITDSPPPQKEELNFDFLRGSQDSSKCLSRSDSSNSLRICEDMSDTNDSNTDLKDVIISEKCDVSNEVTSKAELSVKNSKETSSVKKSDTVPALNLSPVAEESNSTKSEDPKPNQKTSVITPLPPQCSDSIIKEENDLSKECVSDTNVASDSFETKSMPEFPKTEEVEKDIHSTESNSSTSKSEIEKMAPGFSSKAAEASVKASESISPLFPSDVAEVEKSNTDPKENQNSLFDDLLKIKCSSSFTQNSVIMRTPETTKITSSEPVENDVKNDAKDTIESTDATTTNEDSLAANESSILPKEPLTSSESTSSPEKSTSDKVMDVCSDSNVIPESKLTCEDNLSNIEDGSHSLISKKESKRKKLSKKLVKKFGNFDDDKDCKGKEGKSKSKKKSKFDEDMDKNKDLDKIRAKKLKKNKNKKRFAKHEDQLGEHSKKAEFSDEFRDSSYEKIKRKEKRKGDKKMMKSEFDSKGELVKKKKGKKNRDKFGNDRKDFSEKKTKKKRKIHLEDNQDTDSEKDTVPKMLDKKKKKDRKKFKAKECSSSDDATDKFFGEQSKDLNTLSSRPENLLRQESKSDDPDMSFLLCEEKVPASPVDISNLGDDTSGSSSVEGNRLNEMERLPLANVYPCIDHIETSDPVNKHSIVTSAVLDNTPPTTPSSTESLLSSSPSHERDSFSMNYPESTQSGRESCEGDSDIFRVNANRTVMRGSEEYRAAATLAFAVCKSVSERPPKEDICQNFPKRPKVEPDDHMSSKRKKKSKRMRRTSESAKSPRHKSSFSRMPKIENCEDSSGASPATSNSPPYGSTSNINFTRCSPSRLSVVDGMSRYNFYVPLHDKDPEKRIAVIQEKMAELRKEYMALRAKVIAIDHKRRKARKRIREAAGTTNLNTSVQSEDGQSCS